MRFPVLNALAFGAMLIAAAAQAQDAKPEVGTSVAIKGDVAIEGDSAEAKKRKFEKGSTLNANESVVTGKAGEAEIQLSDQSKIAIGPDSQVMVVPDGGDGTNPLGGYTVTVARGKVRFVTAKDDKRTYRIKTPTAYVTTRASVFDVYVAKNGEVAVLVHEGAVDICPTPASCRRHNTVGRFVHVTLAGVLSEPLKWDGSFFKGVAIASAFPFIGRSLRIDPVRRFRHAELIGTLAIDPRGKLKVPVDVLPKTPRSIERSIPIPKPRLPF